MSNKQAQQSQQPQQPQQAQGQPKQLEMSPEAAREFKRLQYLLDSVTNQRESALNSLANANTDGQLIIDEYKSLKEAMDAANKDSQGKIAALEKEKQDLKKEIQELKYQLANTIPVESQDTITGVAGVGISDGGVSGADNVTVE